MTGETVLALVDKKGDEHKFVGSSGKWSHVMHAFDEWALLFRVRLDQAHAEKVVSD